MEMFEVKKILNDSLEKIIKERTGKNAIGFGTTIQSEKEINKYEIFQRNNAIGKSKATTR